MMALRETPLMTDSLVRTLMALEEGWNIFKQRSAAGRVPHTSTRLLVRGYLFEGVTVNNKVLSRVYVPAELESGLILFPRQRGNIVLLPLTLSEYCSLYEDHSYSCNVSRPWVHIYHLHIVVIAEPELLIG